MHLIFSPVGMHRATGLVERCIRTFRNWRMAYSFQSPKTGLRAALNDTL